MNPKELKTEKKLKSKKKSKNGGQQVYVLPPNLLQRLGINLGNVGSSHINPEPEQAKSSEINVQDKKHENSSPNTLTLEKKIENKGSNVNDESSIIKTASLMRESVFLSPTFNNTDLNNVIYSSKYQDVEGGNPMTNRAANKSKIFEVENNTSGSPKQSIITSEYEIIVEHEVNTSANEENNQKINNVCLMIENNNFRKNEDKLTGSNNRISSNEIKNTINIISEETLTPSKLSELNIRRSSEKNTLVRASLNTVIAKNVKKTPILHSHTTPVPVGQDIENEDKQVNNVPDNLINNNMEHAVISKTKCHIQGFDENHDITVKDLSISTSHEVSTYESNKNEIDNVALKLTFETENVVETNNEIDNVALKVTFESENAVDNKNEIDNVALKVTFESENSVDTEIQGHACSSIELRTKYLEKGCNQILSRSKDNNVILDDHDIKNYVHNDNINIITEGENKSAKIEVTNHINQDHIDNNQEQLINNNELKNDLGVVIDISDAKSEKVEIYEVVQKMEYELSDSTNINNNNIDNNESGHGIIKSIGVEDTHLKRIEMPEDKSISSMLPIVSTEQNGLINHIKHPAQSIKEVDSNSHVEGQEIVLESVDENEVSLTETSEPERNPSVSNVITNDDGNNRLSLTLNPKRNNLISKLCSQGVEKPGGINLKEGQIAVLLKTYTNSRKIKHNDKKSIDKNIIRENNQFDYNYLNINETSTSDQSLITQKFCICKDFGMLSYDLYEDIDQHLHFSGHRTSYCEPDIIFSIYGEDEVLNYEEHMQKEVNITDSSEEIVDESVCWCCADSEQYKLDKDLEITSKHLNVAQNCSDVSEMTIKQNIPTTTKTDSIEDNAMAIVIETPKLSNSEHSMDVASDINVTSSNNTKIAFNTGAGGLNNDGNQKANTKNNAESLVLQDISRKRKISQSINEASNSKKTTNSVNCVICKEELAEIFWEDHVAKHCLVSLKDGDRDYINLKGEDLYNKLEEQKNKEGSLNCLVCGLQCKCVKDYLNHVQECFKLQAHNATINISTKNIESKEQLTDKSVTCGVCKLTVKSNEWTTHFASKHNYLAWKDGEKPVKLDDEDATRDHLQRIVQELGELVCNICGLSRKYPKSFMHHIQKCAVVSKSDLTKDMSVNSVVECAVCHYKVDNALWIEHIAKQHNYVAWKVNETPIDLTNYNDLFNHLSKIVKVVGGLKCSLCGFERKYAKSFAFHLVNCAGDIVSESTTAAASRVSVDKVDVIPEIHIVKCGVCKEDVTSDQWITHIKEKHNYQAWREGETPIDLSEEESVRTHLYKILQQFGPLVCTKCGKSRKYVKLYLQHVETCTGPKEPEETLDSSYVEWDSILDIPCPDDSITIDDTETTKTVQCGVCGLEMESVRWFDHVQKEHNYMSWQKGRKPLNLSDEEALRRYLHSVVQKLGALVCAKCGIARKYAKSYMQHVENCTGPPDTESNCAYKYSRTKRSSTYAENEQYSSLVKCDVCKQEIKAGQWIGHIQKQHNYQAWQEGQTPLDLQDVEAVTRHLDEILNAQGQLVCSKCGAPQEQVPLYLEHLDTCTGPVKPVDNIVKCGVCQTEIKESVWIKHIATNHEYIAWKETETPVDVNSYEAIWQHLTNFIKTHGALKCAECGLKRKYAKAYLYHVKDCYNKVYAGVVDENNTLNESRFSEIDSSMDTSCLDDTNGDGLNLVKCGVCSQELAARQWIVHIQEQHNYLAWKDGDKPLDLENEEAIQQHLNSLVQKCVRLTCAKCGTVKRKVAMFHEHIKRCDGSVLSEEEEISKPKVESSRVWCSGEIVKCAVCQTEMKDSVWVDHIAQEHDYLAWRDNERPLKVDNEMAVREHLNKILEYVGELSCGKCGKISKYVRSYLRHRRICVELANLGDESIKMPILRAKSGENVKCAQCQREMDGSLWMEHVAKEHNYVAWKETDTPLVLVDEAAVKDHFNNLLQQIGELVCRKCGLVRKYVKPFLHHLEGCQKVSWRTFSKSTTKVKKEKGDIVKCAACGAELDDTEWAAHARRHCYLAWRDRDPPIDLNNEDEVRNHLSNIVNEEGYLECFNCKLRRKHPKRYLEHIKICDGTLKEIGAMKVSMNGDAAHDSDLDDTDGSAIVKCGVCAQEVQKAQWIVHIQQEHKYLAWQEGQTPLDVEDTEAVYNHLHAISIKHNGLICTACGLVRKYVKTYLQHVSGCSGRAVINSDEIVECGVCGEKMEGNLWRNHAMREHYNIAWIVGGTPIDVRKYSEIEKHMKEYYEYKHKMVCRICGMSRSSIAGFYAHILTCGKTDEEVESYKEVCKICNQKYLCIYKPQHYAAHRAQEIAKERKIAAQKKTEEIKEEPESTSGRRKAAEKAISVIEGYAAKFNNSKCQSCGFESEHKDELANHLCSERIDNSDENGDDSDVSIKLDDYSEEESDDTDIDSNLSNDDEASMDTSRRIRNDTSGGKYPPKFSKLPNTIRDARSYLYEGVADYLHMLKTDERLFPQWDDCNYEVLSEELLPQYLPTLEESCKVNIGNKDWTSYKRFEADKKRGYSVLFAGGCVQCMSWAPAGAAGAAAGGSALCVAAHRAPDCPRLLARDTPRHAALLQMWDFGDFKTKPRLAFGLAHDYGTVWAIDWCPAGARDVLEDDHLDNEKRPRLGLLAMACSNGSAYIAPVPYPDKDETDKIHFYKIKPCVELRVTRGNNKYQATSINWSMSKGYTTISVGYGDGTTAMYDLVTESPLLRTQEGDLTVLYPFQDERVHNSCVTALTSCATGAWCSASATGCAGGTGAAGGARPLRAHVPLAASAALFTPLWPSVLLSGDETIVRHSANEIEWGCAGRRLGGVSALAGNVWRARVAAAAPPLLHTLRPHPAQSQGHKSLHRRTVAMIDMVPLSLKRSRERSNDELTMKVEPITYEEAIQSYGIQFNIEKNLDKSLVNRVQSRPREACPERFPLADAAALAYCPAAAHATRLALATHAGLVFLLDA